MVRYQNACAWRVVTAHPLGVDPIWRVSAVALCRVFAVVIMCGRIGSAVAAIDGCCVPAAGLFGTFCFTPHVILGVVVAWYG